MSRSVNSDYGVLPARGILRKKPADQKQGSVCAQSDTALLERPAKKAQSAEAQAQVGDCFAANLNHNYRSTDSAHVCLYLFESTSIQAYKRSSLESRWGFWA